MSSSNYHPYKVTLSQGQKNKLSSAYQRKMPIILRSSADELTGNDVLKLTKTQINKINKAKQLNKGVDIRISKNQIQRGGALWSGLMSKAIPMAFKWAPKIAAPLATGALQALGSFGLDKILGSGVRGGGQRGGFLIPPNKLQHLVPYQNLLSNLQKNGLNKAIQNKGMFLINPSKKQRGGFLGTVLAAIGIPMAINAFGKLF